MVRSLSSSSPSSSSPLYAVRCCLWCVWSLYQTVSVSCIPTGRISNFHVRLSAVSFVVRTTRHKLLTMHGESHAFVKLIISMDIDCSAVDLAPRKNSKRPLFLVKNRPSDRLTCVTREFPKKRNLSTIYQIDIWTSTSIWWITLFCRKTHDKRDELEFY